MAGFVGNIEGLTQGEGVVTLDGSRHTITAGDAVCRPGSLARGRRRWCDAQETDGREAADDGSPSPAAR